MAVKGVGHSGEVHRVGEQPEDLQAFNAREFADALFEAR